MYVFYMYVPTYVRNLYVSTYVCMFDCLRLEIFSIVMTLMIQSGIRPSNELDALAHAIVLRHCPCLYMMHWQQQVGRYSYHKNELELTFCSYCYLHRPSLFQGIRPHKIKMNWVKPVRPRQQQLPTTGDQCYKNLSVDEYPLSLNAYFSKNQLM